MMRLSTVLMLTASAVFTSALSRGDAGGQQPESAVLLTPKQTVRVESAGSQNALLVSLRSTSGWVPVFAADGSSVRIDVGGEASFCTTERARREGDALVLRGYCPAGSFTQTLRPGDEEGVLSVETVITIPDKAEAIRSVEDRYNYLPSSRAPNDPNGPLDFIWSQNVKNEADGVIPTGAFKSPVVMMQQGSVFAALVPHLPEKKVGALALDLDVTSGVHPWMSFGEIPSTGYGHSYFRRAAMAQGLQPDSVAHTIRYSYDLMVSAEAPRQGYRRITRRLWRTMGEPALLASPDEQRNVVRPDLASFDSWRNQAWFQYADRIFHEFPCGNRTCGTLSSNRNVSGDWNHGEPDAWFNAWFQTLRTAYGWYIYGRSSGNKEIMRKAESVLNLALSAPQHNGMFPSIYILRTARWVPDDGWAGYTDRYHTFDMSWTAWWMLRWVQDLTPGRREEVLSYLRPYANFLVAHQQADGVIPSWYDADGKPYAEFRDFNAETGASALFLAGLAEVTGDHRYASAAEKALQFVQQKVMPRQRWFDFETFLSCSPKDYDFYDPWTAQYPQNNLAEMVTVQAFLELYRLNHSPSTLETGKAAMDYLLLTQQVWNDRSFTPSLLGGFTTQNTDAEWSDARQGQAGALLFDYYRETGDFQYLERSVAAVRSAFSVAPWENWAHSGIADVPGAVTGFHWGTGSAMTSVEMMQPLLQDGLIDVTQKRGVGFDICTVRDVTVSPGAVSFRVESAEPHRTLHLRVVGADPKRSYRVTWNGHPAQTISGKVLLSEGLIVHPD